MKHVSYLLLSLACASLFSCKPRVKVVESPTRGNVTILVDETFYPMVEGQVQVFESLYKYADINIVMLPEHEIAGQLTLDSARIAILSRELTAGELAHFESKQLIPRTTDLAYDAIALIVNKGQKKQKISESELQQILTGAANPGGYTLVFDHSQSSTVQYMKNFAEIENLSNVYSLSSNAELIRYVATHSNTIGFIGIDWLYEPDSTLQPYVDKVRVMGVGSEKGYYKPTQNDIALGAYPFIRKIRIVNAQGTAGLGLGFSTFMAGSVGQRIILKSGLVPVSYPKREIVINNQIQ